MREIILDTETTGLKTSEGHRIIEIGCVELYNHLPTGRAFQKYVNPERDVPPDAFAISGISSDFLKDKPLFREVVDDFLEFIEDLPLVIHNASFDMQFINHELSLINYPKIKLSRTIDTLHMARKAFPGSPANLDALCRRFKIDNSSRTKHGALLDSELLAEVYLELMGGRQRVLGLATELAGMGAGMLTAPNLPVRPARPHAASAVELAAHAAFMAQITEP